MSLQGVLPARVLGQVAGLEMVASGAEGEGLVLQRMETILPASRQMVDNAIEVLSQGWSNMSPEEQDLLQRYFDPAHSGGIDEQYVRKVHANYRRIRRRLNGRLVFELETDSDLCELQRLYYTDMVRVHVCPYLLTETRARRMARQLVHEVVHMALLVLDRPYYHGTSTAYTRLAPRGPWTAQLPVVGRVIGEIVRGDTLYHPDAYARYAAEVGQNEVISGPAPRPADAAINVGLVTDMAVLRNQRHQASATYTDLGH
jgi:hypothetical protein